MKNIIFTILAAFLLMPFSNARAADPTPINICVTKSAVASLIYIAESQGFFKKHSLSPVLTVVGPAKLCHEALVAGRVDVGTIVTPNVVMAGFQTQDSGVRILSKLQDSLGNYLFARADRGIKTPVDLKGKRIGAVIGTTSHMALLTILKNYGLKKSDVTIVPLQTGTISPAIIGGQVDAVVIWYPFIQEAERTLGSALLKIPYKNRYAYMSLLATHESFLNKNAETLKKLDAALSEATEWTYKNRELAVKIVSDKSTIDFPTLNKIWDEDVITRYVFDESILKNIQSDAALVKEMEPDFADKPMPDFSRLLVKETHK